MTAERRIDLPTPDGSAAWIELWPTAMTDDGAVLAQLVAELPLAVERYRMFGRNVTSPRLVSWHGDEDAVYTYSGEHHVPKPWTPKLASLRHSVEETTTLRFNSVLANFYRDGQDAMGWHRDNEKEVGPSPDDRWIASLSLGAPRRFVVRDRKRKGEPLSFELGNGALLVMRGTTQTHYHHALPRTACAPGPRLNLTFRHILRSPTGPR